MFSGESKGNTGKKMVKTMRSSQCDLKLFKKLGRVGYVYLEIKLVSQCKYNDIPMTFVLHFF